MVKGIVADGQYTNISVKLLHFSEKIIKPRPKQLFPATAKNGFQKNAFTFTP
jgi:hypothetical protein